MDRICAWTGGHPYLTQRVARGAARKGGRFEDVERVVREQLLRPKRPIRTRCWLRCAPGSPSRRGRRGARRSCCRSSPPATRSRNRRMPRSRSACGSRAPCASMPSGGLRIRNRIVKELVAAGWLKPKSAAPKWLAAAAVLLAAVAAGGYWYTQRLPVADIETLTSSAVRAGGRRRGLSPVARLAGLRAARRRAVARGARPPEPCRDDARGGRRSRHAAARAAGARRGRGPLAQRVLVAPRPRAGPRRAARRRDSSRAARRGIAGGGSCRGRAISPSSSATTTRGSSGRCALRTRRSIGTRRLRAAAVVSIDAARRVSRTPLGSTAATAALDAAPVALTALEHSALTRELAVDGEGTAGELELSLAVQHAAAGELLVTLAAPSGAVAAIAVPRSDGSPVETFLFQAAQSSAARAARRRGRARRVAVDRRRPRSRQHRRRSAAGASGSAIPPCATIRRSSCRFPTLFAAARLPCRAAAQRAVAWPISPGVVGTLAVWNLATGQLEHDLTLPAAPRNVALDRHGRARARRDGSAVAGVERRRRRARRACRHRDGVRPAARVFSRRRLCGDCRASRRRESAVQRAAQRRRLARGHDRRHAGRARLGARPRRTLRRAARARHRRARARDAPRRRAQALAALARRRAAAALERRRGAADRRSRGRDRVMAARVGERGARAAARAHGGGRDRQCFRPTGGGSRSRATTAPSPCSTSRPAPSSTACGIARSVPVTRTQLSADGTELVTQSAATLKTWRLPAKAVTPPSLHGRCCADGARARRGRAT